MILCIHTSYSSKIYPRLHLFGHCHRALLNGLNIPKVLSLENAKWESSYLTLILERHATAPSDVTNDICSGSPKPSSDVDRTNHESGLGAHNGIFERVSPSNVVPCQKAGRHVLQEQDQTATVRNASHWETKAPSNLSLLDRDRTSTPTCRQGDPNSTATPRFDRVSTARALSPQRRTGDGHGTLSSSFDCCRPGRASTTHPAGKVRSRER